MARKTGSERKTEREKGHKHKCDIRDLFPMGARARAISRASGFSRTRARPAGATYLGGPSIRREEGIYRDRSREQRSFSVVL